MILWFKRQFWKIFESIGLIAIPPILIQFSRLLLNQQTFLSKRDIVSATLFSLLLVVILFTPLSEWPYLVNLLYLYNGVVLVICYVSLVIYINKKSAGVERKRMIYLAFACGATAALKLGIIYVILPIDLFTY